MGKREAGTITRSFRRFARLRLKPGTRKPSVLVELWRAKSSGKRSPLPVSAAKMARAVSVVLTHERFSLSGTFCFIFVDRRFLKELNRQFRNVSRETDVISFSYIEKSSRSFLSPKEKSPLADIYISLDNAADNAARFGETLKNELLRLMIHGTLHALGYTDYAPRAKKKMWARQEKALLQTLP